ncbi:MAG: phosphatidylcholine/phosphatidylserine synthase [Flavobacteriales bacterium]
MAIRNQIPNAVTACNLLSGCIGIVILFQEGPLTASYFILAAGLFDLLDGLVARAIRASSSIGGELDSLADLISFGVLPALICFVYLQASLTQAQITIQDDTPTSFSILPFFAFLIAVFAAIRLARFNLDSQQAKEFKGVPVPANALFWAGIPLAMEGPDIGIMTSGEDSLPFLVHPTFLLSMTLLFSVLMVSPIPCASFKFQDFAWKGNEVRYFLIGGIVLSLPLFFFNALPFLVLLYPVLSLILQPKAP